MRRLLKFSERWKLIQWNLPWTKPGHYGNLTLADIFYSPEDPTWTSLYETQLPCDGGEKIRPLVVPLQAGHTIFPSSATWNRAVGTHVPHLRRNLKVDGRGSIEMLRRVISQKSVIGCWEIAFLESKHNLSILKMNHYEIVSDISVPGYSTIIEMYFRRLKRDTSVIYIFLLLCLCILIVMYALFRIFCFHCANWHSSATLIEVFFRAFSSVVRQMLGYNSHRRGTARTLPN